MNAPVVAGKKPRLVELAKTGDTLLWCACGRSANQPFCDGSHRGTDFVPVRVTAKSDGQEALLCLCKQTRSPPYCDGSHNGLGAHYGADEGEDAIDWSNAETVARTGGELGRANLDGGCFVLTPGPHAEREVCGWRVLATIDKRDGADMLSQWLLKPGEGLPSPITFGAAEAVLFVAEGDARIEISKKCFDAPLYSALAIRPGESLSVHAGANTTTVVATVCPPEPPQRCSEHRPFDQNFPDRIGRENASAREAMGERFYQALTSAERGASEITQFIGMIPKSRSAAHRHLYEETLYILSGEGFMWTESRRAPVKRGDVIYLPRKQLHSLECTAAEGMRLAGSFYPAGSPAINY